MFGLLSQLFSNQCITCAVCSTDPYYVVVVLVQRVHKQLVLSVKMMPVGHIFFQKLDITSLHFHAPCHFCSKLNKVI